MGSMHRAIISFLSAVLVLTSAAHLSARAEWGAPFLRHPAPEPGGRNLAFSFAGDIWLVPGGGRRSPADHRA